MHHSDTGRPEGKPLRTRGGDRGAETAPDRPRGELRGRGGLANQVRRSPASGPGSPGQGLKAEASAAPVHARPGSEPGRPDQAGCRPTRTASRRSQPALPHALPSALEGSRGVRLPAGRTPPTWTEAQTSAQEGSGGPGAPPPGLRRLSRNLESPEWPSPWTRPAGIWVRRPAPGHSPPPLRFSLPWPAGCLGSGARGPWAWGHGVPGLGSTGCLGSGARGAWARGPLPRPRQLGPFSHLPRACSRAQAPRVGRGLRRGGLRCPRPPGGQRSRLGAGLVSGRRATVQSHRRPQGQGAPAVLGARAAPRRARHRLYRAGCRGSRVGGCRAPGRTWCEPLPCHGRCVSHHQAVIGAATGA